MQITSSPLSFFFNDQQRDTVDRSEEFPLLHQSKNINAKQFTRNQPHYSEDEDYFQPKPTTIYHKSTKNSWNIDQPDPICQPDLFELYTRNAKTRQSRQNFPPKQNSYKNNNFQIQIQ